MTLLPRPTTARGEATRKRILDAAETEFGENGFARTSVASIVNRAGVAQGTFYLYFPSKDDVLRELVRDMGRRLRHALSEATEGLTHRVEVEKRGKELNSFDLANLRWSKIIICTDADVDGYQIRTLILTMLWRLVPTLIREGYVYIAESPLYEINCRDKTWFAYTEREKADILDELKTAGGKVGISRSKGLGENDPEMMWLTTMNPETRRLIRVMPEEAERTARVFDLLLGDDLSGRKEHIAENGCRYLELADIS